MVKLVGEGSFINGAYPDYPNIYLSLSATWSHGNCLPPCLIMTMRTLVRVVTVMKLDGVASLITDPPPTSSTNLSKDEEEENKEKKEKEKYF